MKKKYYTLSRPRRSAGELVFDTCNVLFMTMFVILCVFPFYYMFIYSLSDPAEAAKGITLLPRGFTFANYAEVLRIDEIMSATRMSILKTVLGTAASVLCTSFFGYLMTKRTMYCRKLFYRLLTITMYVGAGLIPTYLVYNAYGLVNNFAIYILPSLFPAFHVILVKTYIEQLPEALQESASIDGAGIVRIWLSIILPLSVPILATIAVFTSVNLWNGWFDTHIYITDRRMWTLSYVLQRYYKNASQIAEISSKLSNINFSEGIKMTTDTLRLTITAIVTLPILVVYPFMQRFFLKGLLTGSIKA